MRRNTDGDDPEPLTLCGMYRMPFGSAPGPRNVPREKSHLRYAKTLLNVVALTDPNMISQLLPPRCIQARGVLKKELMDHLRTKRRMRRSQHSRIFKDTSGQMADAISIREGPAEVEDRAVPGHREGDLLSGSRNSQIVTLVERHSRFAMLIKVSSKDTAVVVTALSQHIRKLPATLRRSLTWDRPAFSSN